MVDLEQIRSCDGACCQASPLRPTEDGSDCEFRDPTLPERGCEVMAGKVPLSELTDKEQKRYDHACLNWPQNATPKTQGSWGECCWRFDYGSR